MEQALNQVGWVIAVGELYNDLNPISLDETKTILLERPLVRMILSFPGSYKWLNNLLFSSGDSQRFFMTTLL